MMMLDLYKLVTTKLKEVTEISNQKQYFNINVDKANLPMAIYKLPNGFEPFRYRQDILLEMDIWGKSDAQSIIDLEGIVGKIDSKLNELKYMDENIQVSIYRATPYYNQIDDPDEELSRRKLSYIMQTYFLGV